MTETNNNSNSAQQNSVVAKVKGVQGRVSVKNADGSTASAKNGQELVLGDVIHVKGSSAAVLDFGSAGLVSLGHDQSLSIDQQLVDLLKQAEEDGSLEEGVNFDLLAQAIEEGRSIEEVLPAAAAGEEQDPAGDSAAASGAVRLEFTAEEVQPQSGFETQGLAFTANDDVLPNGQEFDSDFILRANNSQPTVLDIPPVQIDEDVSFSIDLSSSFDDADTEQTLSYEVSGLPEGLSFDPATGLVTGTPTNSDALTNGGSYTVNVTATDNSGASNGSVSTSFELQVVNVNDAPTAGGEIDLGALDEDGSIVFTPSQLLEGAGDIDLDTLSVANIVVSSGQGAVAENDDGDFVFTPDADWNGSVVFSYDIVDGNGGVAPNSANLIVNPVNDAPVAVDDANFLTSTNTAISVTVLANDSDVDGDTLTVVSAEADHGEVTILDDGTLRYTPESNYYGDDVIRYQISDGQGGFDDATAAVSVEYAQGVVTINDLGQLDDTTPVFSGSSSNIAGDLTLTVNGNSFTVTPAADGSWTFTLPEAFALPDGSYDVQVSGLDDVGSEATATDSFSIDALLPQVSIVDLRVLSDSTPTFSGTSQNTDGDFSLSVNGRDYTVTPASDGAWSFTLPDIDALDDGNYSAHISVLDAAGNTASASDDFVVDSNAPTVSITDLDVLSTALPTFSGASQNTDGDLTLTVNGRDYLVTPSDDGTWSFALPAGDELSDGSYIATIRGQDNQGNDAAASDAFVVDAVNDMPIVTGEFTGVTVEGDLGDVSQASGTIDINDPDVGVAPSFEDAVVSGSYGSLVLESGVWTYTLDQALVQQLDAGDLLTDTLVLTATDGTEQTIEIAITGTEDAPVITGSFVGAVVEGDLGDLATASGTLAISDVDAGDNPVFEDNTYAGNYGVLELVSGNWTYTLNQSAVQSLNVGDVVGDAIELIASDGSTQVIDITITGTNDVPVLQVGSDTTEENTVLNGSVPAASDIDGSVVSYALETDVAEGVLTFNPDGSFSFDPAGDFDDLADGATREVSFTYTAQDNSGASASPQVFTITVTGSNDLPVASASNIGATEDSVLNTSVPPASDVDGTIASYALVDNVSEGVITFNPDGSYSFDPNGGFDDLADGESREVSFTYTATDDQGGVSAPATITITVTGGNDLPVVSAAAETTAENAVLNASVPTASDVDGTIASYALATDVAEGSLSFNPDGSYSFDPGAAFDDLAVGESRDVSFTYTATDDQGDVSSPATITITVTGGNDLPIVSAASETAGENTVLNASVPAGSDVDGTIVSYALATDVAEGSLSFNSDGSYSFDPNGDFDDLADGESREVSFTYIATDDQGGVSAPATVTITVTGTNDLPVVSAATETTSENAVLNASVPVASDVDGTIASYALATDVAEGSLNFNPDGSYSFDPGTAFDDLAVGESREVSFTYTATDDQGGVSAPATVTLTITGTNDSPVASAAAETTGENAVLNAIVPTASDVDGTIASYALATDVAEGSLSFNSDGSYSFDPGAAFDNLAEGDSREVSFTYTATDDQGGVSSPATITITVTGGNDLPVVSAASETTGENTVLNASVPVGTDVDGTIASYALATDVAEGSLSFNPDGSYSFDPGVDFDDLAEGDSREVSFTYTATDDQGGISSPATVTITVTGTNDLPLVSAAAETTSENAVLNASVPVASDVDGTVASYALATDVAEGSLNFNHDGSYSFDPGTAFDDLAVGESRDVNFTYTATDDQGGASSPATITITVTGTNDLPVVSAAAETTSENAVLNAIVPTASDVDGTVASYALATDVAEGSLNFNPDGSYSFDPGTAFDDLAVGESRDVSFTYTATDDQGDVSSPATITITVTGGNDLPIVSAASETTGENTVLNASVPAGTDVDGTIASYALATDVAEGSLSFNPDGSYSFDPGVDFDDLAEGESREVSFTYTATDDQGGVSDPAIITITVTNSATANAPILSLGSMVPSDATMLSTGSGLLLSVYESVPFSPWSISETAADLELALLGLEPASESTTYTITDSSRSDSRIEILQGNALLISGFVFLEAGRTYEITGYRDDTFHIELGGEVIYDQGYNHWGIYNSNSDEISASGSDYVSLAEVFTPAESGFYSVEMAVYNGNGPGDFNAFMSVDGGPAQDFSEFLLYSSADDLAASGAPTGEFVGGEHGGYFELELNSGEKDSAIKLQNISASLSDMDGSESLSVVISGIPAGAVLSDGVNPSFTATLGLTQVDVTDWDLSSLTITPPADFVGTFSLTVEATATESSNLDSASVSEEMVITVLDYDPTPASDVQVFTNSGANFTISADSLAFLNEASGDVLVSAVNGDAAYDSRNQEIDVAGSDFQYTLINGYREESVAGDVSVDTSAAGEISGSEGNDLLIDLSGGDTILLGGQGSDYMQGGNGSDQFVWEEGDDGENGDPERDLIADFTAGTGGDVLDFSDLLQDESADASTLDAYLNFSSDGESTLVSVNRDGASGVTQEVVLEGVDLTLIGNDQAIIQQLLSDGNLATD